MVERYDAEERAKEAKTEWFTYGKQDQMKVTFLHDCKQPLEAGQTPGQAASSFSQERDLFRLWAVRQDVRVYTRRHGIFCAITAQAEGSGLGPPNAFLASFFSPGRDSMALLETWRRPGVASARPGPTTSTNQNFEGVPQGLLQRPGAAELSTCEVNQRHTSQDACIIVSNRTATARASLTELY